MFLAAVAAAVPGGYLSASIVLLMVSLMVAMAILIDFQSVVVSPNDYEILAHQPVSSRTYFLVKLTSILLYTGIIGALMGGFATIVFLGSSACRSRWGGWWRWRERWSGPRWPWCSCTP